MRHLPKVELHLHLDCSLSYDVVSRLDSSISRAEYDQEFVAPAKCSSLADFLTRAPRGFQLMQTEQALDLVIQDLFHQLAEDNVIYAEIRFAPLLHTQGGLTPARIVATVNRATETCIKATGIEARLILCTLRHFTSEESLATAQLVEQFRGSCVVALDLAGDEAAFAIDAHVPAFQHCIDHGLNRTAHAGESRGAASVWETLRAFAPSRVGHGARSVEDSPLMEHLGREGIHLEICPTSNVQTSLCDRYQDHPVDKLYRAGVALGINTDARTITHVTLSEEYERLQRHFGWGASELLACNRAAVRAAFVEDEVKLRLIGELEAGFARDASSVKQNPQ